MTMVFMMINHQIRQLYTIVPCFFPSKDDQTTSKGATGRTGSLLFKALKAVRFIVRFFLVENAEWIWLG